MNKTFLFFSLSLLGFCAASAHHPHVVVEGFGPPVVAVYPHHANPVVVVPPAPQIIVETAPPAEIVEQAGVSPGEGFIWVKGSWRWDGRWVWTKGSWQPRPHAHAVWTPGYWVERHHKWTWVEGHW